MGKARATTMASLIPKKSGELSLVKTNVGISKLNARFRSKLSGFFVLKFSSARGSWLGIKMG
jgi:hypothetical protein